MTLQTMLLPDLIRSRRSVSNFTDQPISLELVQDLLETAVYAPNHRLTEPWRFIYLSGAGRLAYATIRGEMVGENMTTHSDAERQTAVEGTIQKFLSVPAYLLVVMTINPNPDIFEEDYAACACVIQNLLLLAWEQGLGTNWKTFKDHARLRSVLGIQAAEKVVGIIHIGYPTSEVRTSPRQMAHTRLTVFTGEER